MKKTILTILLCGILLLGTTGCNREVKSNTSLQYQKVTDLKKQDIDTSFLFKFNGVVYGKSNKIIDYAGGTEPVGKILKLIDSNYVPKNDGETNQEVLLNAPIYSVTENSAVVLYDNTYVLFEKVK